MNFHENKFTFSRTRDVEQTRTDLIEEYKTEEVIVARTRKKLLKLTKQARMLTNDEVQALRDALDRVRQN